MLARELLQLRVLVSGLFMYHLRDLYRSCGESTDTTSATIGGDFIIAAQCCEEPLRPPFSAGLSQLRRVDGRHYLYHLREGYRSYGVSFEGAPIIICGLAWPFPADSSLFIIHL